MPKPYYPVGRMNERSMSPFTSNWTLLLQRNNDREAFQNFGELYCYAFYFCFMSVITVYSKASLFPT